MMGSEGISVADALALQNRSGSNGDDGAFGGNGAWWVIILILFMAIGGWGRGFGGNGGSDSTVTPYAVPASMQGMTDAFNFSQLDNSLRGLEQGLCNGFYTTAQQINGVVSAIQNCCCETQQNMLQGFNGVDKSICQLGYNTQTGFNTLASQLASCCCDIQRGQDATRYDMAQMTNQLLVAGDKNTDRIINFLTQSELANLRQQNEEYRSQLQIQTQNRTLIDALLPVAKPAYLTCSPYASAFGYNGYGLGNGCGCGC